MSTTAITILVAKILIKLMDIGPAESSPEILEITFKLIIINTMKKMAVKAHFFIIFKDVRDDSEKALFLSIKVNSLYT